MKAEIRQYQKQDLSDLLTIWESASRIAHSFMAESFFEQGLREIPTIYIPNADTWIAVIDQKMVGFIALINNEVGGLFVDPNHHGNGIGRALMDKAQELHGDLEVDVFKENPIGRRFYDRYGFKFKHEKIWPDSGDIMLRMAFTAK
ncbi:GNAT family N-acetyltransferase [Psychromonas ossibalaenae]|uniref:GNAT family N-acetyltransferase n=1 Tax=Psychromonas ossibalaenae TaxID=444922 RepID=UPI000364A559|nr:GNAT family N-acetyltransferase [Psychromonas ossibalaenae]